MKDIIIKTERLTIKPKSLQEMMELQRLEKDSEMKQVYKEMTDTMNLHPGKEEWGTSWTISLLEGTEIGGMSFKGVPDARGNVEIGYDIKEQHRKNGYATEAVKGIVMWALKQKDVKCVLAQTEPDNEISKKVLLNNQFTPCGFGGEGPLFKKEKIKIFETVFDCEIEYIKCFSSFVQENNIIRFRNDNLPDRYNDNISFIKTNGLDTTDIILTTKREIAQSFSDNLSFAKIMYDTDLPEDIFKDITYEKEISYLGLYLLNLPLLFKWDTNDECTIITINTTTQKQDLVNFEVSAYEKTLGTDYCIRSSTYTTKILDNTDNLKVYAAYINNRLVGKCQLFNKGSIAKIEDLEVAKEFHMQKIATSLLKKIIMDSTNPGVENIFLVTDENDTPKNMYSKLGFKNIGIRTDLFIKKNQNTNNLIVNKCTTNE